MSGRWPQAGSDQWRLSKVIGTQERFCHIIRNFVDYFLNLMISMCHLHAFERAFNTKKLRVKDRISPDQQLHRLNSLHAL
jgi:hypothetical protein